MRNKIQKTKCVKQMLPHFEEVVKTYDALQEATARMLSEDDGLVSIRCNVDCCTIDGTAYTTDFLCKRKDGSFVVYECVYRKYLDKPKNCRLLDKSQKFWYGRGVEWILVIDKE